MKCVKCGISTMHAMLHRTEPKGQNNAGWMCLKCIDFNHPELANNIRLEKGYSVLQNIKEIVNPKAL